MQGGGRKHWLVQAIWDMASDGRKSRVWGDVKWDIMIEVTTRVTYAMMRDGPLQISLLDNILKAHWTFGLRDGHGKADGHAE